MKKISQQKILKKRREVKKLWEFLDEFVQDVPPQTKLWRVFSKRAIAAFPVKSKS